MTELPLGRVIGLVLDRHAHPESGSAVLLHSEPDGSTDRCRVHWRDASTWRVESRRGVVASDGTTTWSDSDPPHPARQGHPPWHLMPVFPLRAPVWGRMGDDCFPASTGQDDRGTRLTLTGTEDDRTGSVVVDHGGFLVEITFASGTRLELCDLDLRPQPDALFVRP